MVIIGNTVYSFDSISYIKGSYLFNRKLPLFLQMDIWYRIRIICQCNEDLTL